jgi:hypothetical protein
MLDLYNKQYDRQTLKNNIYAVSMLDILKTQLIDVTFAVRYILNTDYHFQEKDKLITFSLILKYQPQITSRHLENEIANYDSDDDSIEDFESVSNKK